LNEKIGSVVYDHSGNDYHAVSKNVTRNQSSNYGAAYRFAGANNSKVNPPAPLSAAMDMREYSISAWVKVNVNPALQVRVFNIWTPELDGYHALEVRGGNANALFWLEGGVDQTINSGLPVAQDEVWVQYVMYNSETEGVSTAWIISLTD
jgi:hypothetical protein